jgi:carbonic anhydrase
MSAIDQLLRNNASYVHDPAVGALPSRPRLEVAVLACMDARIDVHRVLGLAPGEAHVIRNAGGVVTDDVIRSLLISQRLLGTREVMVIHHTECGMQSFRDEELKAEIEKEVGVRPPFALGSFSDLREDVRESIRRILSSPFLAHKDRVRGFIYDVRTGRLEEVTLQGRTG